MVFPVSGEADSGTGPAQQGDNNEAATVEGAGPPSSPLDAAAAATPTPAPPAARWDRASDAVSFD